MLGFTEQEQRALVMSTFAGLSTGIGALFAVVRRPNDSLLAMLLGVAIGVMMTLSVAELWIHNALDHDWTSVTTAVVLGALLYKVLQPFMPDFDFEAKVEEKLGFHQMADDKSTSVQPGTIGKGAIPLQSKNEALAAAIPSQRIRRSGTPAARRESAAPDGDEGGQEAKAQLEPSAAVGANAAKDPAVDRVEPPQQAIQLRPGELLRLGLLMALTMTLHNLPEGMAVGFAAFTSFGPIMTAAIAVHNIPEGVIVAAPVYAATGSRWKAVGLATASGLSEPLGCMLALLALRPFLSEDLLQYMLAFVGGIMAAVCVLELLPEARKCRADSRLAVGVGLGTFAMGWTLWVGV